MNSLDGVIKAGIQRLKEEDLEAQEFYIKKVCEGVRGSSSELLLEAGAFFVPNNNYMRLFFGREIEDAYYDCYDGDGECKWNNCLVMPVTNLVGKIVGLAGFNPINYLKAKETLDWSITYYSYSHRSLFDKSKYLFCLPGVYQEALKDGYICVLDGFFDTVSATQHGFHAAGLLGSVISQEIAAQLRFFNKVIVLFDNDEAGLKVVRDLKKYNPHNTYTFLQGKAKDADEILKSELGQEYEDQLRAFVDSDLTSIQIASLRKP